MSAEIDEVRAVAAMLEADRDRYQLYARNLEKIIRDKDRVIDMYSQYCTQLDQLP